MWKKLNMLQTKLWPVVKFTEQWAKKLTYNTDNNYNTYSAYNNYNATITCKCDHLAQLKHQLS